MRYASLKVDFPETDIVVVALNRPDAANALTTEMTLEINDIFSNLSARVAILSGLGKHFCAGADLKERKGMDEAAWKKQHEAFRSARDAILDCPAPVIAAVHGAAYAGGLELALACDFIYAAEDARFALTEATLGIMPGMGGTQNLPRSVPKRRAKELLYTGKSFTAKEAASWGMVNALYPAGSLMDEALNTARTIAANAPLSLKAIKQAVDQGMYRSLNEGFEKELTLYNRLLSTQDRQEGINAWGEKRKPVFKGE